MPQFNDDLYSGGAQTGVVWGVGSNNISPNGGRGIGPMGRVFVYDITPAAISSTNAGTIALGATVATFAAGTGSSVVTNARGESVLQFGVPRGIRLTGTNAGDTMNITFVGYDYYGVKMSEVIAGPGNATTQVGLKAFYQLLSATAASVTNAAVTFGGGDKLGLPYALANVAQVMRIGWNSTLAADAGTVAVAVTTDPSTTTTGDVRGTYIPSSATDGTKRLVFAYTFASDAFGMNATSRTAAMGVQQNLYTS